MNIQEALLQAFGESARKIDGFDRFPQDGTWGSEEVRQGHLAIDAGARLFCTCGGKVIATWNTAKEACRLNFNLVVDSSAHDSWMWKRAAGEPVEGSCPSPILRLVASA